MNKLTDTEIIANQTRQIAELIMEVEAYKEVLSNINQMIFCIGAPLNDNINNYNTKQLHIFCRIAQEINSVL